MTGISAYFDTSFLVSLYAADKNTALALRLMPKSREVLLLTPFTELETVNAIGLCIFRNALSSSLAQSALQAFEEDMRNRVFTLKPLPEMAFVRALQISRQTAARLGTRASDVVHVASALELGAEEFYTFDRQQARLAEMMKLKVNALA